MPPEPVTQANRRFVVTRIDAGVETNVIASTPLPQGYTTDQVLRAPVLRQRPHLPRRSNPGVHLRIYSPANVGKPAHGRRLHLGLHDLRAAAGAVDGCSLLRRREHGRNRCDGAARSTADTVLLPGTDRAGRRPAGTPGRSDGGGSVCQQRRRQRRESSWHQPTTMTALLGGVLAVGSARRRPSVACTMGRCATQPWHSQHRRSELHLRGRLLPPVRVHRRLHRHHPRHRHREHRRHLRPVPERRRHRRHRPRHRRHHRWPRPPGAQLRRGQRRQRHPRLHLGDGRGLDAGSCALRRVLGDGRGDCAASGVSGAASRTRPG